MKAWKISHTYRGFAHDLNLESVVNVLARQQTQCWVLRSVQIFIFDVRNLAQPTEVRD